MGAVALNRRVNRAKHGNVFENVRVFPEALQQSSLIDILRVLRFSASLSCPRNSLKLAKKIAEFHKVRVFF